MFSPDYLFIVAGILAAVGALIVLVRGVMRRQLRLLLSALLWVSLASGCFLQGFAPNLRVERNAFVMPVAANPEEPLNPRVIVERERHMKVYSAVFLAFAAVGLFVQYRALLFGAPSQPAPEAVRGESAP